MLTEASGRDGGAGDRAANEMRVVMGLEPGATDWRSYKFQ